MSEIIFTLCVANNEQVEKSYTRKYIYNGDNNLLAKYTHSPLGTVTDIADTNGNIVQRYEYSAYGKILSIQDGNATDITASPKLSTSFTYTGREWAKDAGLYYNRARYCVLHIPAICSIPLNPQQTSLFVNSENEILF